MTTLALLALLGCAPKHSLELAPARQERVVQFAIQAQGHSFAGLIAAVFEGDGVEVAALTPAGTELFRVARHGDQVEVHSPDEDWTPWLERLPFDRDLPLVFLWDCPQGRCVVHDGVLRQRSTEAGGLVRTWRGSAGPVSATIVEGRAVISDPRRGYTVTLVGEAIHVP